MKFLTLLQVIRTKPSTYPAGSVCNIPEAGQTALVISGDFYDFNLLAIKTNLRSTWITLSNREKVWCLFGFSAFGNRQLNPIIYAQR